MTTYDPCSLEFSTFQRYDLFESKKINSKPKREIEKKPKGKENKKIIGPGEYDILNYWQGKKNMKNKEDKKSSLLNLLSKGPVAHVYH